mmetsp:Transcript_9460/g.17149  ORF Transcript_9460/g.17149 Transcript_9460/m.17149 type:complete len:642 (-) Transcript_9460:300-2225(-)
MSRAMHNKAGSKSQKKNPPPLRIMIKCMWNGERVALPPPGSSVKITSRTTLSHLMFAILMEHNNSLAAARTEGTLAVQHMRTMVPQSEWDTTTLADIGVENSMGSALLTLHNNHTNTNTTTANNTSNTPMATIPVAPARVIPPPPSVAAAGVATTTTEPEPMNLEEDNVGNNNEDATTQVWTTWEAVDLLLQSNFDADSKECIVTLLKLLDNIISSPPSDVKYRTLNLDNEALQKRVFSKRGGLEFVQACGFAPTVLPPQLSFALTSSSSSQPSSLLELTSSKESLTDLQAARRLLVERAVRVLEMDPKDLPKAKAPRTMTTTTSSSSSFDPYKTHNFNAQAAALGAPNPLTGDREPSRTESQLQALKSKQERLERKLHTHLVEREWVATRPGAIVPPPLTTTTSAAAATSSSGGGGSGDGSLLAAQMKRRQEERKKREEGGFTTQAMRDLEQMKKSKVYSHVQLRINFSDGSYVTGKFLPKETLETVRQVLLKDILIVSSSESSYDFDLYVAPPRRKLDWSKTIQAEGLVPAAKLHVSWKVGGAPTGMGDTGWFIQPALFETNKNGAASFPDAKSIVQSRTLASQSSTNSNSSSTSMTAEEKEAAMMRRMLGQKPKLKTTKRPSSDDTKKPGTNPTWFKK